MHVVLGDRQTVFLESLASALHHHGHLVPATCTRADDLVAAVGRCTPDVCLTDLLEPSAATPDLVAALVAANPDTKVVVLTTEDRPDVVAWALEAGAAGFVHKSCAMAGLLGVLTRVARDEVVVDGVTRRSGYQPARRPPAADTLARLTARELQCLRLLEQGASTKVMARALGVSPTTVRTHVQSVMTKLNVHSRLAAASLAVRYRATVPGGAALPVLHERPEASAV